MLIDFVTPEPYIYINPIIAVWSQGCQWPSWGLISKSSGNKLMFFLLRYTALYMLEIKHASCMLRIINPTSSTYELSDPRKVTLISL